MVILLSAKTASAQYRTNVSLEAECPSSFTGAYGTKRTSTASFSGPGYIKSQGNVTVSTYNNTSADHAVYNFDAGLGGFWTVFFRVNTNGNAANDSLFYRVNGSSWETVTGLSSLGTGWRWAQAASLFPVAGPTTLEIANRETGLEIDKIALLNSGDPVPTGTGAPAYNCPVTMYFEAECPTTASGAYPFKRFLTKTGYSGAGYLYSQGNNTGSATSSTDIAIFPFDAGTSTYSFYFRVDTNGSANDDSWFYRVDSGAWTTMNNITNATGWRWVQGTATAALTVGRHALEVRNREDGLNIDKIAFIPSGGAAPSGSGGTSVNCDPAPTMSGWGFWEQTDYATTHQRYFEAEGAMVIDMHVDWHHNNDPGGRGGLGSGIAFLGMHRAMVNDFRAFALSTGRRSWIPIDMNAPLPYAVSDASGPLQAVGPTYYDTYYAPREGTDLTNFFIPPYLTASGGPVLGILWTSTFQFHDHDTGQPIGPVYSKLGDIPDLDTLGRIMGESFFHDELHNYISGTMGTLGSPADPFFYGWHGLIDTIADNWLNSTAGRNWINANPNHPFLQVGFTHMDGWNDADWAP